VEPSQYEALTAQLADIGDERLDQLVKDARKLRATTKKDKIPQALKDSLVRKHDRIEEGQVTSIIIKPELCFTFTVKAHKDWEETEVDVKLINPTDKRAAALFQLLDIRCYEWEESDLTKLELHLGPMREQERMARQAWDDDYYHLRSEFGVNAYDLVAELKKDA
jgi:hypothetical protein